MPDARNYTPPVKRGDKDTVPHTWLPAECLGIESDAEFQAGNQSGWTGLIVYVKATRKGGREFARFCHATNVAFAKSEHHKPHWCAVCNLPAPIDGINAFEVYAPANVLDRLKAHQSVIRSQPIGYLGTNAKAQGSMPKKR